MMNTGKLSGLTIFITGASRGIGKAIALKAARDGANIVIAAKTAQAHPKLPGTIYTACKEVEEAGGKCLPCIVDVRDENAVKTAVQEAVNKFGGIDIVVNNASAIRLTGTAETDMKYYDLMHHINTRGTFLVSKLCLPHLKQSKHAHILNLSPPLSMQPKWFSNHVAYTMAKFGMSMCVLGMAEEFKPFNIAVNALWPKTAVYTAAMEMLAGTESGNWSRKPEIVADAAYSILCTDPPSVTGNFFIDEKVLLDAGIIDLDQYAINPEYKDKLMMDLYIDDIPSDQPTIPTDHAKKNGGPSSGQVSELFVHIEKSLSPELTQKVQALYEFHVTGKEAGKWFIDLRSGTGSCGFGEPPATADATLTMDSKNFFDMFNGKLKPANAYMTGKLKISGNLQKALKLEKLMNRLKAKL